MAETLEKTPLPGNTNIGITKLSAGRGYTTINVIKGGVSTSVGHQQAVNTIQKSLETGVNYIDSALYYGGGKSLELLGEALGETLPKDLVLSFKVGRVLVSDPNAADAAGKELHPTRQYAGSEYPYYYFDYSREGVHKAFEQSMQQINKGRANRGWAPLKPEDLNIVIYVHDPGVGEHGQDKQPGIMQQVLSESYPALWELQQQGKIKAYGVGTNEIAPCLASLKDEHIALMMLASRLTLFCNGAPDAPEQIRADSAGLQELLDGLRAHPHRPKIVTAAIGNTGIGYGENTYNYAPASAEVIAFRDKIADALTDYNTRNGTDVTLFDLMLHYPLTFASDVVATVMSGPREPAHAQEACDSYAKKIPKDLWEELQQAGLINPALEINASTVRGISPTDHTAPRTGTIQR